MPDCSPESVLRNYFHAKDKNRPHLLGKEFCGAAARACAPAIEALGPVLRYLESKASRPNSDRTGRCAS